MKNLGPLALGAALVTSSCAKQPNPPVSMNLEEKAATELAHFRDLLLETQWPTREEIYTPIKSPNYKERLIDRGSETSCEMDVKREAKTNNGSLSLSGGILREALSGELIQCIVQVKEETNRRNSILELTYLEEEPDLTKFIIRHEENHGGYRALFELFDCAQSYDPTMQKCTYYQSKGSRETQSSMEFEGDLEGTVLNLCERVAEAAGLKNCKE
jgi:hypothetical protein